MNEQEAMYLRDAIKEEFPWVQVDIHWHKAAGVGEVGEALYTLWLWKDETDLLFLESVDEFLVWKRAVRLLGKEKRSNEGTGQEVYEAYKLGVERDEGKRLREWEDLGEENQAIFQKIAVKLSRVFERFEVLS